MKKRSLTLALALVLTTASILTACGSSDDTNTPASGEPAVSSEGTELKVCVGPEPDTIDPALNSALDGGIVISHLFEGLMKIGQDGVTVEEGIAESYEISEDQLTYTFTLRDGLKWSDGSDLTAEDIVYSWNRAVAPETAADYSYIFECIEGYEDGNLAIQAIDEKTFEVKLVAVTPYFLELCAFPVYFPVQQETVEAGGESWATDPSTYISNGAYKMVEWEHDSYILLEKNENYWDVDSLGPDAIRFVLMGDPNAELAAFESGELAFIDDCPTDEIEALKSNPEFHIQGQIGTYYISFNVEKEPLNDPLVRKALTLAIDRQYICDEIGQSGQQPAGAFVATGLTDADPSKEFREVGGDYYDPTDYEGNLELAKEILAEAGYPNGEGLPTIEYLYNNESDGNGLIGEALQSMWGELGINVELVSQEWATFLQSRKNGDYMVARNGWMGDYNDPISFLDMWTTGGGNNDAQWSNSDYDALIKQIKSSSDPEERMQLMHQCEDMIFDDWMLCPIYFYVDSYLVKENLDGFYSTPLGYKYFHYATVTE